MKEGLTIIPVAMVDEALSAALVEEPLPKSIGAGSGSETQATVKLPEADDAGDDIVAH